MMWLTLSSEHEQTLSDPTVYQWNIPLLFLPLLPPLSLLAYHGRPIRRSFNFSFQLQFFLMSSQLSSDNISPSVSVSPLPACQSVVPFLPPPPLSSLVKSICLAMWCRPVDHHMGLTNAPPCKPTAQLLGRKV